MLMGFMTVGESRTFVGRLLVAAMGINVPIFVIYLFVI